MTILAILQGTTTTGAPGTVAPTYVASGSTWNAIGPGGGGARAPTNTSDGKGGGGGGHSQIVNVTWTASQNCQVSAGGAGATVSGGNGANGASTTWVRIDGGAGAPTTTAQGVLANPGAGGGTGSGAGGAGGSVTGAVGTTTHAGGTGGASNDNATVSTGGGGAGGIGGTGGNGGADTASGTPSGGTGGGANGGGGAGVGNTGSTTGTTGGTSITTGNQTGTTGGAGGTLNNPGTAGTNGAGGGGGGGSASATAPGIGGAGGPGTEWDATHGSGGGGAGGGGNSSTGTGHNGAAGGAGGLYGGGGGGGGQGVASGNGGNGANGILVITWTPAATQNFGWFRGNTEDQKLSVAVLPEREQTFVSTFQTAKTPTAWFKPARDDPERLPPIQRSPDEAFPFFVRSPNPVPILCLPIGGIDREKLPPIKRSPDEPNGYFFLKPGTVAPPNTWMPITGEEDRPANPNRTQAPDESFPWFVRSSNPVPATWLPIAGIDRERLPPIQRTDWQPTFVKFPAAAPVGISGIAWCISQEQMRPPVPSDQYYYGWAPQSPTALVTFMAQTNADDFNPLPRGVLGEMPVQWLAHPPFAAASTIAGIAWWRPVDDARLIPGWGLRRPDDFAQWFVPSSNPVPTRWLPNTGEEDRPPAQKRPPDEPGAFFRSPQSFLPVWLPTAGEAERYIPPTLEPYRPGTAINLSAQPVGISGIAWWQSIEVHLGPLPPQLDYQISQTPRVPPPPVGIAGIAWWRQTEVYVGPPPPQLDYVLSWNQQFIVPPAAATLLLRTLVGTGL